MSPEQQNFDQLRRLLALKRHEVPPPGYYANFSREVVARIRAGERGESASSREWQTGWWHRFWNVLEAQPVLAGAVGAFVCGAMVWTFMASETPDSQAMAVMGTDPVAQFADNSGFQPMAQPASFTSTNRSIPQPSHGSLFDDIRMAHPINPVLVSQPGGEPALMPVQYTFPK
jgi:hypothetical protein